MTGRGRPRYIPPVPKRDPTLDTNPIPEERHFQVRSFGPGAAPDILTTAASIKQLKEQVNPQDNHKRNEIYKLLKEVEFCETITCREDGYFRRSPTWGFYIQVTSYTETARENLDAAVQKMVESVRRSLYASTIEPYAAEAFKRLKFDIIEDEEALRDASDDRVREEMKAQVRGLHLTDDEEWKDISPMSPGRYQACLVLDEAIITELAGLDLPEKPKDDYCALKNVTIKMVGRHWNYREEANLETMSGGRPYTGVDVCPLYGITELYYELTDSSFAGAMEGIFPFWNRLY